MADLKRQIERRWAMVRILLGMLQTIGAITLVVLLILTGVNTLTVTVAILTALFLTISLALFRGK